MRRLALVLCALLALAGASAVLPGEARADIYTYTDEDGVVHFTNIPPRGRRGVRVAVRTPDPDPSEPPRSRAGGSGAADTRDTSSERYHRYDAYIAEAAALYTLPEAFIRAVIRVESDYSPGAVSHCGAEGLMQLMPGTAARMGVTDSFDPRQNILGGSRYLRVLANAFEGDLILTIAAYNAGEGAVIRHGGIPPFDETRRYVGRVLGWYYRYLSEEGAVTLETE